MSIQTEINRLNTAKESIRNEFKKIGLDIPSDTKLDDYYLYIAKYNTMIQNTINNYWKKIYPIGAIIETENLNFDPNTEFGGTWERTLKGKFPVGYDPNDTDFNVIGKTGGEKNHTLTVEEMPSHSHTNFKVNDVTIGWVDNIFQQGDLAGVRSNPNNNISTNSTGGGKAHNNVPPYQVVAKWVRKA